MRRRTADGQVLTEYVSPSGNAGIALLIKSAFDIVRVYSNT